MLTDIFDNKQRLQYLFAMKILRKCTKLQLKGKNIEAVT